MMNRREFVRQSLLAGAAIWFSGGLKGPPAALAVGPSLHLALLADAHLRNGDDGRPEARSLARAVAEIKALRPKPEAVLFAGDLAHDGNPQALALGREILADLPAPLLAVRGEGDGRPADSGLRPPLFEDGPFLHAWRGVTVLGLDTVWQNTPQGPAFALEEAQRRWLAATLPRLDPHLPLVVLSHAPLSLIFRPWGQWTRDASCLTPLLARFRRVISIHGHLHQAGVRAQGPGAGNTWSRENNFPNSLQIPHPSPRTPDPGPPNLPLPATAWPLPEALVGTPRKLRPGAGPRGCGWLSLTVREQGWEAQPRAWLA